MLYLIGIESKTLGPVANAIKIQNPVFTDTNAIKHLHLVNTGLESVFAGPVKCNPRKQILALDEKNQRKEFRQCSQNVRMSIKIGFQKDLQFSDYLKGRNILILVITESHLATWPSFPVF